MPSVRDTHSFFVNTILLGGSNAEKVRAARDAGFVAVEVWTHDVDAQEGGATALRGLLADNGVRALDYQVLRDFDGAPDHRRQAARDGAERHLDVARELGASTILVAASTDPDCVPERVVQDLRWLADRAAERSLTVAYESLSWSSRSPTLPQAWASVRDADHEALGIVIDPFHTFVRERTAADLDGIPVDKIFLVQLSDLVELVPEERLIETARHHRVLPGDGVFDIHSVLARLLRDGYRGPIGLEVFNDDMRADDPWLTSLRAMTSLRAAVERAAREAMPAA